MSKRLALLLAAALWTVAGVARAEASRLAPIPEGEAKSTHGPYQMGACETCHERRDPKSPGAAVKVSNDLCFDCHDEFRGTARVRMDRSVHPRTATAACTGCHNPHNARKRKLRI